jgi:hypothetical protein
MKRRRLSDPAAAGLTPALLEQWIGLPPAGASAQASESSRSFRLSTKAHVLLIAALDKNIPCWLEKHDGTGRIDPGNCRAIAG